MNWLTIVLAMLGKLAITSSYGTVYVFSTEQFPTVIRNAGLGACSMSARIGGILAPYINLLVSISYEEILHTPFRLRRNFSF